MKPSEYIRRRVGLIPELQHIDKHFISKEQYDDLHSDFSKMTELCGKAQRKLRQARKELKKKVRELGMDYRTKQFIQIIKEVLK